MDAKLLARRVWILQGLNFKVKKLIDEKSSFVLNNENPEISHLTTMEDISKLLSLEWKLNNQLFQIRNQLERVKEKVGAQS